MIIIDREAAIKRKIIIGVIALVVLVAAGFAVWYFFIKTNKSAAPTNETPSATEGASPDETNGTVKTEDLLPEIEAENKFKQDRGECLKKFMGLENLTPEGIDKLQADIVGMGSTKTRDYYACRAIKNNDSTYCDVVNANKDDFNFCQSEFALFSGMLFPALKSNSCDQQMISACAKTGSPDCENVCQGYVLNNSEACNNLKDGIGSPLKSTCIAINNKDISVCSALKEVDDQKSCQEIYYFTTAAKENNLSGINNIDDPSFLVIANLYFNKNYNCEKLLAGFGDDACNNKYNSDYLQEQINSAKSSQGNE